MGTNLQVNLRRINMLRPSTIIAVFLVPWLVVGVTARKLVGKPPVSEVQKLPAIRTTTPMGQKLPCNCFAPPQHLMRKTPHPLQKMEPWSSTSQNPSSRSLFHWDYLVDCDRSIRKFNRALIPPREFAFRSRYTSGQFTFEDTISIRSRIGLYLNQGCVCC